jgi:FkbM family methyltransferase
MALRWRRRSAPSGHKRNSDPVSVKSLIRAVLRGVGYDLVRYNVAEDARARRNLLLEAQGIEVVLDVGANRGEYGLILRDAGYRGPIHSFEPLSEAHGLLQRTVSRDGRWWAHHMALGDADGEAEINVAGNSYSSSILGMTASHEALAPSSAYTGKETIQVSRLDSVWSNLDPVGGCCLLKIDTQGYELAVLQGAGSVLDRCPLVELELSFVELYGGQPLFDEVHAWMGGKGYRIVSVETGPGQVSDSTGETLQVDVVYLRDEAGRV